MEPSRLDNEAAPAPDRHRPLERSLALAAALAGFVIAAGVIADNSFLTHLATGRYILDTGSVPSTDPYSRFGVGEAWTVQSWLASVIYAGLEQGGGIAAIRLFHGVVGAVTAVALWRLTAPAVQLATRVVLTAAPLVVGVGLWSPRPLLIGLAGLVGVLLVEREDRSPRLLVPLLWVWANAHGSFPLGLGVLVLIVAGRWLDDRRLRPRDRRLLGWATLGTALATVGPLGLGLLTFPLRLLGRRDALVGVTEWEAPTFTSPAELMWLAIALTTLVAARRGLGAVGLLPAAVFSAAAFLALRNVGPAAVVVVASIAPGLAGLGATRSASLASARVRSAEPSVADRAPGRVEEMPWSGAVSGVAARSARAIGLAAGTALVVAVAAVATSPALELDRYPVEAVDALERNGLLADPEVVVVHREAVGNYLTWRLGPDALAFVDDRFDFHDDALLVDHRDLLAGREAREILDRRGADVVLWENDGPLVQWLVEAPEWSTRTGAEWTVACRIGSVAEDRCPSVEPPPALAVVGG